MEYTKAYIIKGEKTEGSVRNFRISDQSVDRDRDIIVLSGMNTSEYMQKNPIIMYLHSANRNPDPDLVIGKAVSMTLKNNELFSEGQFDVDGEADASNALAKKVLYKYDNGFLNMSSIGFSSDWSKYGPGDKEKGEDPNVYYHRSTELFEWSAVPVPSNRNASIQRSFEDDVTKNVMDWLEFIVKENLKGADLEQFIRNGFRNAPELVHLENKNNVSLLYRRARIRQTNLI